MDVSSSVSSTWIASSQCSSRHREEEREQLRSFNKESTCSLKHVRRVVRKRARPEAWTALALPLNPPPSLTTAFTTDPEFDAMTQQLQAMYGQLEPVFQDPQMSSLVDGIADLRIHKDRTSSMTAALRESRLLPFDAASTAEALWRIRQSRVASESAGIEQDAVEAGDTIRQSFTATVHAPSYQSALRGRILTQRFLLDGDHFLILHCTRYVRATRNERDPEDQFGCQSINWTIVRPRDRADNNPVCQILVAEVASPFRVGTSTHNGDASTVSRELRDFSLERLKFVHAIEKQTLENWLLDPARLHVE